MDTEPTFDDALSAAVVNAATDAAATEPAADMNDFLDAIFGGEEASPAEDGAPDEEAPDGEALAVSETLELSDRAEEDDEPDEDYVVRLERERDDLLQAKREAEAAQQQAEAAAFWQREEAKVNDRLRDATEWLQAEIESGRHYDTTAFLARELPTVIEGYATDLRQLEGRKVSHWQHVARQHGTLTYLSKLQADYGLTDGDMAKVRGYPPEFMEKAARDILDARGEAEPIKAELTTTKGKLTKTANALKRAKRGEQIVPSPVSSTATLRDVRDRITEENADQIAGSLFAAIGLNGR